LEALQRAGRPVGLSTLASMLYSDEGSVKEYEQLLIDFELVDLRSNGRVLSREGKKYLLEQTP
jgi:Holliday junction resolvasome RuvABC ATP-dependent DNA helicase subunit